MARRIRGGGEGPAGLVRGPVPGCHPGHVPVEVPKSFAASAGPPGPVAHRARPGETPRGGTRREAGGGSAGGVLGAPRGVHGPLGRRRDRSSRRGGASRRGRELRPRRREDAGHRLGRGAGARHRAGGHHPLPEPAGLGGRARLRTGANPGRRSGPCGVDRAPVPGTGSDRRDGRVCRRTPEAAAPELALGAARPHPGNGWRRERAARAGRGAVAGAPGGTRLDGRRRGERAAGGPGDPDGRPHPTVGRRESQRRGQPAGTATPAAGRGLPRPETAGRSAAPAARAVARSLSFGRRGAGDDQARAAVRKTAFRVPRGRPLAPGLGRRAPPRVRSGRSGTEVRAFRVPRRERRIPPVRHGLRRRGGGGARQGRGPALRLHPRDRRNRGTGGAGSSALRWTPVGSGSEVLPRAGAHRPGTTGLVGADPGAAAGAVAPR